VSVLKKEQISKKNKAKEELRKQEDFIANRVMAVFSGAVVMLWGLAYLWRGYDVGATLLAAIKINNILIGVSAVGFVASLIWWISQIKKGTNKERPVLTGSMFALFFGALLVSVLLIKYDYDSAKRVLYVVIPGAAILHLVYSTYQREFFSFALTHSVICYLLWIMAKTYNPSLELAALAAILVICVVAFVFFLLAKRHDGEGHFGPITIRLYDNKKLKTDHVALIYGGTALLAGAAFALGNPYAYYILYALVGLVVGAAVYFTVKLI
ncbi:MAG: hypothetical protein IJO51_07855, partial [Clostridia bacterium]|nr:hypothetical protein [Clostridia bacterium]